MDENVNTEIYQKVSLDAFSFFSLPASSLLEAALTDQPKAMRSNPAEKRFGRWVLHSALAVDVAVAANGAWPIGSELQQTAVTILWWDLKTIK